MNRKSASAFRSGTRSPESVFLTPPTQPDTTATKTSRAAPPTRPNETKVLPSSAKVPAAASTQYTSSQAPTPGGPQGGQARTAKGADAVPGSPSTQGVDGAGQNPQNATSGNGGQSQRTESIPGGGQNCVPFVTLYLCAMLVLLLALSAFMAVAVNQLRDAPLDPADNYTSRTLPKPPLHYVTTTIDRYSSYDVTPKLSPTVDEEASTSSEVHPSMQTVDDQ
ncbi:uncharacterized protein LOC144124095 [Amblyomma americanum]